MSSRFFRVVTYYCGISFFLKAEYGNSPSYGCFPLSIHLLIDRYDRSWGCFCILTTGNSAARNTGASVFCQDPVFSVFDTYSEVALLTHMVVLFLIFWGTSILFSIVTAAPIYITTNSALWSTFLHTLTYNLRVYTNSMYIYNMYVINL